HSSNWPTRYAGCFHSAKRARNSCSSSDLMSVGTGQLNHAASKKTAKPSFLSHSRAKHGIMTTPTGSRRLAQGKAAIAAATLGKPSKISPLLCAKRKGGERGGFL